jgi:hypothetical protein
MHAEALPITGPCPIDLDAIGFDRSAKVAHCSHCAKNVTVLSNMTRREAREFLREHAGQRLCVSYARGEDGQIRFRPEPEPALIPASRLRPRVEAEAPAALARAKASRAAGLVAALGVGVALAACTPHGEPPRETATTTRPAVTPITPPRVDPVVEGNIEVPDPKVLDEPCEKGEPRVDPGSEPIHAAGAAVIPREVMMDGEVAVPARERIDAPPDGGRPTRRTSTR